MTNSKFTKRALLTSVLSLIVCLTMLIGTTFAWFTDTASTGVNKIQSGNLDVALEMKDNEGNWVSAEGKTLQFKKADGAEDEEILWEPGCSYELPELRVVNKGSLALKYKIIITGIDGDAKLNEVIDWTLNDAAINLTEQKLAAKEEGEAFVIKGKMQSTAGNEYQGLSIDGIAITVYATQDTSESDSFDNQYDADAAYKGTQEFTDGTYTLNKGGVALNPDEAAVKASGEGTNLTITGGFYDGGKGGNNRCIQVESGATVTIKDGTFTVGGDADGYGNSVVLCKGGNVIIEGGFFYTDYQYKGKYYVLNQQNNDPGTITVKGGTFVNYDPSKGDDNLGGNFVADGYSVIEETQTNGDVWYTVVKGTGAVVGTQEEMNTAIDNNSEVTVKLTNAGTYSLPEMTDKEISIVGTKDTVIDMKNKTNKAQSLSFEGVTVNFGTEDYRGFQHTGKLVYKDCTITGKQFLYGNEVEFYNCVFEQDVVDYNVWTYGAGKVLFNNCTFNCKGKSVLIYNEGSIAGQTVEFQNCKFNASASVVGKAAIEIDSSLLKNGATYKVIIDKATADNVTGFGTGSNSKNSVWNNKKGDKATVIVDGSTVLSAN